MIPDIWVELTTLVVPGQNDSKEELKKIPNFLARLIISIPWHISRFYLQDKMEDRETTSMEILNKACDIGINSRLRYVYLRNAGKGNNT